ncbi:hypothetical protein [Nocardia cyriacigeorgica]|uniref:hypothetical protein n=1 Tax=Nocardia cyriacigeorgica TaxID=135487 RepID=UPI0024579340|nr:hypothetical protein [Nocardia cyriacigeorgica]
MNHTTDTRDHCRLDNSGVLADAIGRSVTYHGPIRHLRGAEYTITGYNRKARMFFLERPQFPYAQLVVGLSSVRFTPEPEPETPAQVFAALRSGHETVVTDQDGEPVAVVLTIAEYVELVEQARWGRN